MPKQLLLVLESILVGVVCISNGCSRSVEKSPTNTTPSIPLTQTEELKSEPKLETVLLEGTLIRKGWRKTGESWNAGGSHYYVLDVGGEVISHRSSKEGVILRPSKQVAFNIFEQFKERRVAVKGKFVEGKPWTPKEGTMQQHPVLDVDPTTGKVIPILRGSGFQVFEIIQLDDEAP